VPVERSGRRIAARTLEAAARRLLGDSALCAIATTSPRVSAYVNTAYFAWSDELDVYWLSEPGAEHSRNIRAHAATAIAVFDSAQSWGGADRGLQLFGSAAEVVDRPAREAERVYGERFPAYVPSDFLSYRFYRFRPRRLKLFDERVFGVAVFVTARVGRRGRLFWQRTERYADR
jgi:uncharacterized protein YhbP (UPF0306 family)